MKTPAVVAFDVMGTLFSLESLRPRLVAAGLEGERLETWYASLLRDAMALEVTGVYRPFAEVAKSTLISLGAADGANDHTAVDAVIEGLASLEAYPDAAPTLAELQAARLRIVALTNGNAKTTHRLLERSHLLSYIERIISIDEIRRWKPQREVYLHCATVAGVAPDRLALVAAHGWDVHGAKQAGLSSGYVSRPGTHFPSSMEAPDITGSSLVEVARQLIAGLPEAP